MAALGTIATVATIAAAAASLASIGYAAAQEPPKSPDLGSSSRQVAEAQARALPTQRAINAAQQQGGKTTISVQKHKSRMDLVKLPKGPEGKGKLVEYRAADWRPGGQYYGKFGDFDPLDHIKTKNVKVPAHEQEYDFSGYGTADIEGELARQFADIQSELGKKYGVEFAKQARAEAEMADPLGFAARDKEREMIQEQLDNPIPINPLARTLDERLLDRAKIGPGFDDMSRELLDKAVDRAAEARGGTLSPEAVGEQMSTGMEGNARRQGNIGQVQSWLSSGATPEDTEYRREQQNMANLGAFVSGQTPQSQFANLSAASQGAAPFVPGQRLPQQPNNASTVGPAYSIAAWQSQLQNAGANPWMAGLSGVLNSVSALNTAKG